MPSGAPSTTPMVTGRPSSDASAVGEAGDGGGRAGEHRALHDGAAALGAVEVERVADLGGDAADAVEQHAAGLATISASPSMSSTGVVEADVARASRGRARA